MSTTASTAQCAPAPLAADAAAGAAAGAATWRTQFGQIAFLVCGLILLAAAALKLFGTNVSPVAQFGWLHSPTVQVGLVVWEALLGVWLLSGFVSQVVLRSDQPISRFAWIAAFLTFVTFAGLSGYLGIIGQADCGCFGALRTSPWVAFAVDVTALVLLYLGCPRWKSWRAEESRELRRLLYVFGSVVVVLASVCAVGIARFGSLEATIARLRGESLGVSPAFVDFGSAQQGESVAATVTIRNYTDNPVKLIGGWSDCSCLVTRDMPLTIEAGESATIGVYLLAPKGTSGQLTKQFDLFTNCPNHHRIRLTAVCQVTE
jgi:hypothetical protein